MTRNWQIQQQDATDVLALQQQLECATLLPRLLIARGMSNYSTAYRYLAPSLQRDWGEPGEITGMSDAAAALTTAIKAKQKIVIFGDYDVDGLTSSAIMLLFLQSCGCSPEVVIPHRLDEGYGLSETSLKRVFELSPDLLITVDCGISARDEVALLNTHGIAVIITDHHELSGDVPQALAVTDPKINPKTEFGLLAGAGVVLKLVQAVGSLLEKNDAWLDYLDLASLGTIADVMPLIGANRALVQEGLLNFQRHPRPGIEALLHIDNRQQQASARDLSFGLIPRLNAAGRMDNPTLALELLLCANTHDAAILAERLDDLNTLRRSIEQELFAQAMLQVEPLAPGSRVVIAAGEGWHDGVRGIVASRLVRATGLPSLVFSIEDGIATGSGRSVGEVNLFQAVMHCEALLERFGGHAGAVGVTLAAAQLPKFSRLLNDYVCALPPEQFFAPLVIDAEVDANELTIKAIDELQVMEPLGHDNPQPCLMLKSVRAIRARRVGEKRNHLAFTVAGSASQNVAQGNRADPLRFGDDTDLKKHQLDAIWFNCPAAEDLLSQAIEQSGVLLDIAFTPQVDEWRNRRTIKLNVLAVRLAEQKTKEQETKEQETKEQEAKEQKRTVSTTATGNSVQELTHSLSRDSLAVAVTRFAEGFLDRCLGASARLHKAQLETILHLAAGRSTLAVMATGRGKSLIFQVVAAWLATQLEPANRRGTIIVFPLRALLNDQYFHLSENLSHFGLKVQRLSGETPADTRQSIKEAYQRGEINVLLTTPEFLAFNREQFAGMTETGLLVFDEAHHIATSSRMHRPVYTQASSLCSLFPVATVLALSATAGDGHAQIICSELNIATVVRDSSVRPNLRLVDKRGEQERLSWLASQISSEQQSIIYVNSRASSMELTKELRKRLPDFAEKIVFYHAGMDRSDRLRIEEAFRLYQATTIVATSAFGEGVNIPDIRQVFLYHLPFAAVDLNQMSGRAGRDGLPSSIHLLYGVEDAAINRGILNSVCEQADSSEAVAEAKQQQEVFETFQRWALESAAARIERMIQGPILPAAVNVRSM